MAWKNLREDIAADLFGDESFADVTTRALASQDHLRVGEGSADRKARLIAEGLCPCCGLSRDTDAQLCSWCAKKHANNVDAYRERLRALGACSNCGAPTGKPGKWKCAACTKTMASQHTERRDRWRRDGLCTECGRPPAAPGRKLCRSCADRMLAKYHARKAKAASTATDTQPST